MALNWRGDEKRSGQPPPVTLPKLFLPSPDASDIEREIAEAAARVAEQRIIRAGVDAWKLVGKAESFENWKLIGKALQIGRGVAVRATGARTGKHYANAFYAWADRHGFSMTKEAWWSAVDLVEHLPEIEQFRSTLPEKQRRRLVHPLSNLRAWRRSQTPKAKPNGVAMAEAAWARFVSYMQALAPDQAAALWTRIACLANENLLQANPGKADAEGI